MAMNILKEVANLHKALSSVTRLRIIRMLIQRSMCVNAITARLGVSQPTVSQHLAVLERAGIVFGRRDGCRIHYSIDTDNLPRIREALLGIPFGQMDDNDTS